jgi:hypothetical protein
LKCSAVEGWRRSVGLVVWKTKKYYRVEEERNNLHTVNRTKANWTGHSLSRNCLLQHVIEGEIQEKIGVLGRRGRSVSSYWMTLRKREDTGNRNRRHSIAVC